MAVDVGICGWARAQDEVIDVHRLMEVQRTFYKPPQVATAQRWSDKAPEGFTFTLKAWQTVTHPASSPTYRKAGLEVEDDARKAYGYLQDTPQVHQGWQRTVKIAEVLDASFIVLQCPPSFDPNQEHAENLRRFVKRARQDGFPLAWEPRGQWTADQVDELCQETGLIHATDPFAMPCQTPEHAYLRLHGRPASERNYSYTYTDEDLDELVGICRELGDAWVLFNNHTMFQDAQRFRARIQESELTSA